MLKQRSKKAKFDKKLVFKEYAELTKQPRFKKYEPQALAVLTAAKLGLREHKAEIIKLLRKKTAVSRKQKLVSEKLFEKPVIDVEKIPKIEFGRLDLQRACEIVLLKKCPRVWLVSLTQEEKAKFFELLDKLPEKIRKEVKKKLKE